MILRFTKECPQCLASYITTDKRQKYCSMSCRGKSRKSDDRARLMSKVEKSPGCWRWTGCVNNKGYGIMPFDKQCDLAGLPKPVAELAFAKGLGRRWRFDWAWVDQGVALEIEGGVFIHGRHSRGAGMVKDMAKYNTAAILGWRILRVTPTQIANGEALNLVDRIIRGRAA